MTYFTKRFRIVPSTHKKYKYMPQVWRWWWPFWWNLTVLGYTEMEDAQQIIDYHRGKVLYEVKDEAEVEFERWVPK